MNATSDYAGALRMLTVQRRKADLYASEFVADEAWQALLDTFGAALPEFVYGYTFLIIKPEAIARRLTDVALQFVLRQGYIPIAHTQVVIGRAAANAIWRFQWNAATPDRVRLTHRVNAKANSLFVLLRGPTDAAVPGSVKLWALKGSAHPERRAPHHLRTWMQMHNRMLGFVHCPDEPADLVRELGILFDYEQLRPFLEACAREHASDRHELRRSITALEDTSEQHSVHPAEVLQRLAQTGSIPAAMQQAIAQRTKMSLGELRAAFSAAAVDPDSWDALTVCAELICHDRDGVGPLLDARSMSDVFDTWSSQGATIQAGLMGIVNE